MSSVAQVAGLASRMRRIVLLDPLARLAYPTHSIVLVLEVVSRVFLFYVLWSAVYGAGQISGGLDVRQAITYSTLATLFVAGRGFPPDRLSDRIRDGSIVYLFVRPLPPVLYYWGVQLGGILTRSFLLFVGAVVGIVAGVILPPPSLPILVAVVVSLFLAELLFGYFFLYLETVAFWTTDIWGVRGLYFFALQLLSGALVPIWFFPKVVVDVLAVSPFAAATSTPVSLYVGRIPADAALPSLLLQAAWLVVLAGLGELFWRRAQYRIVVQGG